MRAFLRRNNPQEWTSIARTFSQAAPEAIASSPLVDQHAASTSSPPAVSALREKLSNGPDLGDFIRGSDVSDYSVYAPLPKVSL